MIKVKLSMLVCVFAVVALCGLSFGTMWVPTGTSYVAPQGGTLVLSEDYGSGEGRDGIGSWIAGDGNVTFNQTAESLLISTSGSRAQIDLPFQPRASAGTDFVIDIGVKGWSATQYSGGWWHNIWWIQSAAGNGMQNRWITNYGNLQASQTGETTPYAQNTEYVFRFSAPSPEDKYGAALIANLGDDGICAETYRWAAPVANFFGLYGAGTQGTINTTEISWIRVYTGITSTDAALVPEPMTLALLGLGGLFIRRRK